MQFPGDKLIRLVLVQFLLSPLILITADAINASVNNGGAGNRRLHDDDCLHSPTVGAGAEPTNGIGVDAVQPTGSQPSRQIVAKLNSHHDNGSESTSVPSGAPSAMPAASQPPTVPNEANIRANVSTARFSDGKILSRKRRYLIFPPGSSVQIGMCLCLGHMPRGFIRFTEYTSCICMCAVDGKCMEIRRASGRRARTQFN